MLKLLNNPLVAIVLTVIAIGFWFSLFQTASTIRRSSETLGVLEQEVAETASEVSELQAKYELAQDPFTQEKIAREELLLQKPGEIIIKLSHPPTAETLKTNSTAITPWQQWRELLW